VNNNKGVFLQANTKQKMPPCQYGEACNRPKCIYSHPLKPSSSKKNAGAALAAAGIKQSAEPCMSYLAGLCTFSGATCRKRHPPKAECERLIAKYASVKCKFGSTCRTRGCLYVHDDGFDESLANNSGQYHYTDDHQQQQCLPVAPQDSSAQQQRQIIDFSAMQDAYMNHYHQNNHMEQQQLYGGGGGYYDESSGYADGSYYDSTSGEGGYSTAGHSHEIPENNSNMNHTDLICGTTVPTDGTNPNAKEYVPGKGWA